LQHVALDFIHGGLGNALTLTRRGALFGQQALQPTDPYGLSTDPFATNGLLPPNSLATSSLLPTGTSLTNPLGSATSAINPASLLSMLGSIGGVAPSGAATSSGASQAATANGNTGTSNQGDPDAYYAQQEPMDYEDVDGGGNLAYSGGDDEFDVG
jgi:hypothetical protein